MRFISDEDFLWAILVMLLLVIIANGNRGTAEKVTLAIKLCVCPSYSTRLHSFPTSNIIIIIFTTFQYFFVFSIFYSVFQYSSNSNRLHSFPTSNIIIIIGRLLNNQKCHDIKNN